MERPRIMRVGDRVTHRMHWPTHSGIIVEQTETADWWVRWDDGWDGVAREDDLIPEQAPVDEAG